MIHIKNTHTILRQHITGILYLSCISEKDKLFSLEQKGCKN
jgi:hypothetical protein